MNGHGHAAAVVLAAIFIAAPHAASGTELGDLAASMAPGEWRELSTEGFEGILVPPGGEGALLEYMDEALQNPLTRKIYIIGCARATGGSGSYVCDTTTAEDAGWIEYDENTNAWRDMPPSPVSPGFHSYDHAAMDPATGDYYYREIDADAWKYAAETWTSIPRIAESEYEIPCCSGFEFFPELGGLVFIDGPNKRFLTYRDGDSQWTETAMNVSTPVGEYHVFSEYSADRGILYFGGGVNDERGLYVMGESLAPRRAAGSPVGLGHGGGGSIQTIDPQTGNLLVFAYRGSDPVDDPGSDPDADADYVYEYDPDADAWTRHGPHPLFTDNGWDLQAAAAPVEEHGVVFVANYAFDSSRVYLYRHSPGQGEPPPDEPLPEVLTEPDAADAVEADAVPDSGGDGDGGEGDEEGGGEGGDGCGCVVAGSPAG